MVPEPGLSHLSIPLPASRSVVGFKRWVDSALGGGGTPEKVAIELELEEMALGGDL